MSKKPVPTKRRKELTKLFVDTFNMLDGHFCYDDLTAGEVVGFYGESLGMALERVISSSKCSVKTIQTILNDINKNLKESTERAFKKLEKQEEKKQPN